MTANPITRQKYTIDDLLLMPDDGKRYELINGEIIEVGTSNERHSTLGAWLVFMLMTHVRATKLGGRVKGPDGTYRLNEDNIKVPDVSYLTPASAAKLPQGTVYCPFAPDFVIEVKSPRDSAPHMQRQAELYISNGTQLVWTVDPINVTVTVYSASGDTAIEYSGAAVVDASDVVPGFKIDLTEMAAEVEGL